MRGEEKVGSGAHSFDAILTAAQAGAGWARTIIWTEHAGQVTAFLAARGAREPEDLASEVFIELFAALPRFTGDAAALRGFLFSIAYRRLVDEFRTRARRRHTTELDEATDPRRAPSAAEEAERRLGDAAALRMLDALPPDQRDVLTLRIVADLPIDQVALILGKRPDAVKQLQRRGLERLRKNLARTRHLFGPSDDGRK
jgi:RNA polymerase sigma-70 factor (ECF subfamily)